MAELEPQPAAPGKLAVARDFLVDTRIEMDKVTWPSKDELTAQTKQVLISSLAFGVVIGLVDYILQQILINGIGSLAR
jgi:preprotein translocase SecE subunit